MGIIPSISILEHALDEIKSMSEEQFGYSVFEELIEEDGIEFTLTRNHLHRALFLSKPVGEIRS